MDYATQARNAIDQARRDAAAGVGTRCAWVVITSSYSVDIDHVTEAGKQAEAQLACGDIATAIGGLEPVHTEVGFRIDNDGKGLALTRAELALQAQGYNEVGTR